MPLSSQVDRLAIATYAEPADLVSGAVDRVYQSLRATLQRQSQARVILASGGSQIQFLKTLTTMDLDWSRITCFHLDEYLGLGSNHPASFQHYMRELVADRVPLKQFHYLDSATLQPLQECRRYGELLAAESIDLCLLGIGDNGHIAFNDPLVADFQDPDPVKIVKLADKSRQQQVDGGFFAAISEVPQYAMTLTIPSICRSQQIVCLALGERKAAIVQQMLQAPVSATLPATILRQQLQATLLLDRAAAALL